MNTSTGVYVLQPDGVTHVPNGFAITPDVVALLGQLFGQPAEAERPGGPDNSRPLSSTTNPDPKPKRT